MMGIMVRELGELERGTALTKEGVRLARELGDKRLLAMTLTQLADSLGEETLDAAWAKGRIMTLGQAIEYALTPAG